MDERASFLDEPPESDRTRALYEESRESDGYIPNYARLWAWRPDVARSFRALREELMRGSQLTERDWAVLVTATAAAREDSYCALAWGRRLARLSDGAAAAHVIAGEHAAGLSAREQALAAWARQVVQDPNAIEPADVERLRRTGLGDRELFEATVFVALRLAFSTVNDALGAAPDRQLADAAPEPVRAAVRFGRPPAPTPSRP